MKKNLSLELIKEERKSSRIKKISELVNLGIENIWFYVHQPGESRERILFFYNTLIPNINILLNTKIPLLKNYSYI